jgi:glycosyltransferase involved in cell wall biosynthesis
MEDLKGGGYLLKALPHVVSALGKSLNVMFIGDGPARAAWQASAVRLATREQRLAFAFTGWVDSQRIAEFLADADLLVVPSLWPEPFGLVGLEAARHGVPVAAFAVGGIPDWLRSDVNGHLAPGDPPTPEGLARAIIACLEHSETHARLREGARRIAAEFSLERHVDLLMGVLVDAVHSHALGEGRAPSHSPSRGARTGTIAPSHHRTRAPFFASSEGANRVHRP